MGVRSHIWVHFVLKILLGAELGRSHKTSLSYNRGSYNAGTTVLLLLLVLLMLWLLLLLLLHAALSHAINQIACFKVD